MKLLIISLMLILPKAFATSCAYRQCQPGQLRYTPTSSSHMSQGCSQCVNSCPAGTYAVASYQGATPECKSNFPSNIQNCYHCQQQFAQQQQQYRWNPYFRTTMPWMMNQPQRPWWATQGNFHYPNFQYPGAWSNHGIDTTHYPGGGGGMAMKPNIYVKNENKKSMKFSWKFKEKEKAEFLATTPALNNYGWEGSVKGESYTVKNVDYSYLFYDARMDHKKMQFESGVCLEKENLIPEMLSDLSKKSFTKEALKDFTEHWSQKLPNYPYFCIYPQLNKQMNVLMPIDVTPVESIVTRVLYVLVPYEEAPKVIAGKFPSLPTRSSASLESVTKKKPIKEKQIQFFEWGIAFLDGKLIQ